MTCSTRLRKIPSEGGAGGNRVCCSVFRRVQPPYPYEPETVAYFEHADINIGDNNTVYFASTAQEITGNGRWLALDNLFKGLKTAFGLTHGVSNLSTIFDAMYPAEGDTATMCKYNVMTMSDTNGGFRLSFSGGWTFSATGMQPNGTNSYANTFWTSSAKAGQKRVSFGAYYRTNNNTGTQISGCWDLNNPTRLYSFISGPNFTVGNVNNNYSGATTRFHGVRATATVQDAYRDNAMRDSQVSQNLTLINIPFYWGVRNNNDVSRNQWTTQEIAFAFITGAVEITHQQMLDMNAAIDAYQLARFRNV